MPRTPVFGVRQPWVQIVAVLTSYVTLGKLLVACNLICLIYKIGTVLPHRVDEMIKLESIQKALSTVPGHSTCSGSDSGLLHTELL